MNTAFFDATGKCIGIAEGDQMNIVFPEAAFRSLVGLNASPNSIYCDTSGEVLSRQPFNLSVSTNVIEGLPAGTQVVMPTSDVVVDDGRLELEVAYPQTLRVTLVHPHYLEQTVEVPCEA